jgi:phospholipid/cholesterol/gamma-HCH transport system substrate-binding protein
MARTLDQQRDHGSHRVLGAIVLLLAVGFCGLVFSGTLRSVTQPGGTRVQATFATTARMPVGARVRVHGVDVGRVDAKQLDPGGRTSTVTLVVDGDALPLHRDATVAIHWRTILGGNYQVVLDPGTAAAGPLGSARIPASQTSTQVEADDLLSALREQERGGIATMLTELPHALSDAPAPRRALDAVAAAGPDLAGGLKALRGEDRDDLQDLVGSAARTVAALDTAGPTLTDVVEGGAGTLGVTARRAADVQATITASARIAPNVRTTIRQLQATLRLADPVLAELDGVAPAVAPTLTRLRPVVTQASALLGDARPLLRDLRPAASALAGAAQDGRPLLHDVEPALKRADETILPDLAKPDKISRRPTYQMIGSTVAALDAAAAGYDAVSHFVALTPGAGERALDTLPCRTYFGDAASPKLIACQQLSQYLPTLFGAPSQPPTRKARR